MGIRASRGGGRVFGGEGDRAWKGSCDHMAELEIALRGGGSLRVMDYASAGKKWEESGKIAAWIRTGKVCKDFLSGQKAPAKKI